MSEISTLGIQGIGGDRLPIDMWYVYLPANEDRDKYVQNCKATFTVSLINLNNEVMHKVPVGKSNLQYINFPKDSKELGSPVICGNIITHNQPIVLQVYEFGDTFNLTQEYEKRFTEKTSTGTADFSIKGKKGQIFINVDSELEDGGQIFINVTNKDKKGKLNISVNGELIVNNVGKTSITTTDEIVLIVFDGNDEGKQSSLRYTNQKGLFYKDEFDNEFSYTDGVAQIISKKIKLGQGKEPLLLGDTTTDFLKDFLTAVSSITVVTAIGTQPIVNKLDFEKLKKTIDKIKSKLSFTD